MTYWTKYYLLILKVIMQQLKITISGGYIGKYGEFFPMLSVKLALVMIWSFSSLFHDQWPTNFLGAARVTPSQIRGHGPNFLIV